MASLLSKQPILIRDEGEAPTAAHPGTTDPETGALALNDRGEVIDPPRPGTPGRAAWPADTGVMVKPRITGDDLNLIQKLKLNIQVVGKGIDPENLEIRSNMEIYVPAIIEVAVLGRGLRCPIIPEPKREDFPSKKEFEAAYARFQSANWFEDPTTRPDYVNEDAEGSEGTGQIIAWPDLLADRLKVAGSLPSEVLLFASSEVGRLANTPLPGTTAVAA